MSEYGLRLRNAKKQIVFDTSEAFTRHVETKTGKLVLVTNHITLEGWLGGATWTMHKSIPTKGMVNDGSWGAVVSYANITTSSQGQWDGGPYKTADTKLLNGLTVPLIALSINKSFVDIGWTICPIDDIGEFLSPVLSYQIEILRY